MNSKLTSQLKEIFIVFTLCVFGFQFAFSQDTFSIIAIDSLTQEIGAAGATCSDGIAGVGGVQIINQIIPGKGGVNAQAWICSPNANLIYAIKQINENRQAEVVLDSLLNNDQCNAQNYDINFRQYGIITIDSINNINISAHTGDMASDVKGQRKGKDYAIIGNNLTSETSSTSTFLRVYKPDDNINEPYLYLNIAGVPQGIEPLDSLQILYDDFIVGVDNTHGFSNSLQILNTLVGDEDLIFILSTPSFSPFELNIYNVAGVGLFKKSFKQQKDLYSLDLTNIKNGLYILTIQVENKLASRRFQVLR